MRIVALSDTHGYHRRVEVPAGDVLVHAGDFTRNGDLNEFSEFMSWVNDLPHQVKVIVPGNHDKCCENMLDVCKSFKRENVHFLVNDSVTIDGKVFYGSPHTPQYGNWSFMRARGDKIAMQWSLIPESTDVLITHGPAYGHGDLAESRFGHPRVSGCLELLKRIQVVQPQLHIFGHIHEGYGITRSDELYSTTFINAATCNRKYQPINPPIVITIR